MVDVQLTRRSTLASLGLGVASAGCLGSATSDSVGDVDLLLNWHPNGLHAPYYAARAQGFYEDEGLTVTAIESGQGSDFSAKQAGLGNADLAVTSSDQVLLTAAGKLDVLSVATVMQQAPNVVFATPDSLGEPLETPEQLAGTRVGTGPGMVRILTSLYLSAVGVRDSVELVDTGYDTVQRLLAGKVDAAGGVFADAIDARNQGATVDTLRVSEAVPAYGHVLATAPSFASENAEAVDAFLRGTAHGAAWASENPGAAIDALVEATQGLSEVRAQERETWETMASGFMTSDAVREHGWGWSVAEPWNTVADALADAGDAAVPDDVSSVWTTEYLDTSAPYIGEYPDRSGTP